MPRKDFYHDAVRRALEKDAWRITHDPFVIKYKDLTVVADLAAEKIFVSENGERKIVVEIKVFGGKSKTTEFEKAKGQYDIYQIALKKNKIESKLFLAISVETYKTYFSRVAIREIIAEEKMNLLIFNAEKEEIVEWINWSVTEKL